MAKVEYDDKIKELENLIRSGETSKAKNIFRSLIQKSIPRRIRPKIAELARRCNLYNFSLKVLYTIIENDRLDLDPASPQEKLEYATSLVKIGSYSEAFKLFDSIEREKLSEVLFRKSILELSRWNYEKAKVHLLEYIECNEVSDYKKAVAFVNLTSCYLYDSNWVESQKSIKEARNILNGLGNVALLGNLYELEAQLYLQKGDFGQADRVIQKSLDHLQNAYGMGRIFALKWQAIIELNRSGNDNLLKEVSYLAKQRREGEVIRDLEYHLLLFSKDKDLFQKLYFGTPFESFQKRLLKISKEQPKGEYIWSEWPEPPHLTIDLIGSLVLSGKKSVKLTKVLDSVLRSLTNDFYKSTALGEVFSDIYPDEYFDPHTAYNRVQQTIRRLRRFFENKKLPIVVEEVGGTYQILFEGPIAFKVPARSESSFQLPSEIRLLQKKFSKVSFTAKQARDALGLSFGKMQRILLFAVEEGLLTKSGQSRSTTYSFEESKRQAS